MRHEPLLQLTGGKDEPNIVFMRKSYSQHTYTQVTMSLMLYVVLAMPTLNKAYLFITRNVKTHDRTQKI
jgi:hypothetical protein